MKIRRILVPTDFSKPSVAALEYAADLARQWGATLFWLHVIEDYEMGDPLPGVRRASASAHAAVTEARHRLKRMAAAVNKNVELVPATRIGLPDDEIVGYAKSEEIDLIVMATAGRRGVNRLVMGSVTEAVVRSAPCPVLSLRHPEDSLSEAPLNGAAKLAAR